MSVSVKALLALMLLALLHSGSAVEKLASCCTSVSITPIKEPIVDALIQKQSGNCVRAVIVQTEKSLYCVSVAAKWLKAELHKLQLARASAATQTQTVSPAPTGMTGVSLLSIITSTAQTSTSETSSELYTSAPASSTSAPATVRSENKLL